MSKLFSNNTFESLVIYAEDDKTLVMDEELEGDFDKLGDTLEAVDDITELQDVAIECKDKPHLLKEHLYRYSNKIDRIASNLGFETQLSRYLSLSSEQVERGMDADLVSRLVLEESKGFLSELWHRIKMFFTKIFEAIAGIFVGFDDKKESAAESAKEAIDEALEEDLSLMSFSDEKAIKTLFSEKETKTYKKSEIDILKVMERYNTVTSVVSNIIEKSEEYNKTRFDRVNKYIDKLIEYSGKDDKLDVEAEKKKDDYFSDKKAHSIFSNSLEDGVKSSFGYNDDVVIGYKIIFTDPSKGILKEKVNIDDKIKLEGEANDKILLFPNEIVKNNKNKFIEFIDKIKQQNVSKNMTTLEKLWQEESKKLEEKIKKLDEKKDNKPELHTEATKVLNAVQTVYKNELQTIAKLATTMDKITIGVMSITSDVVNNKSGSEDGEKPSSDGSGQSGTPPSDGSGDGENPSSE